MTAKDDPGGREALVLPVAGVAGEDGGAALCRAVRRAYGDVSHLHRVDVTCDATGAAADLGLVAALARLALTARRHGCTLRVRGAAPELRLLIELVGLADVLPVAEAPPSGGEDA